MIVLMLVSGVVFWAGLIALFKPLPRIGLTNRKRALLAMAGSTVLYMLVSPAGNAFLDGLQKGLHDSF
jgi:hypothetical protein